jgi:integrase
MKLKLPRYVHGYTDRHGRERFYFRRRGFAHVPLPGLPWSPQFMAAYEQAMAGQPITIGAKAIKPGTMRALGVSYFNSVGYLSLEPTTRRDYRNVFERFCTGKGATGIAYGDQPAADLQRKHVVRLMAERAGKPNAANKLLKVLRAVMSHAVENGFRNDDPARDVKPLRIKTTGFHSWTEAEIEQYKARHQIGTKARLALVLPLCTGQRRSDVVPMGRQHIRVIEGDDFIFVRQQKTGVELYIPILPELQAIIADTPKDNLTFLVTECGKPFTSAGFGNWFRDRCNEAGLRHCSAHGLRKAAARRFAEYGCTPHEIAAITGHASLREVQRYTKGYDQRLLATSAMAKVKARTSSG